MKIVSIKHVENYKLEIKFSDKTFKIIDLENFIKSCQHPLIKKYENIDLFKNVYLDETNTPCWGNNEFDISPKSIIQGDFDIT